MRNPGWIDLQVNGCSGIDFSSPELTGDDFLRAAERVLESGTGCFLPTLITSPFGPHRRQPPRFRHARRSARRFGEKGCRVLRRGAGIGVPLRGSRDDVFAHERKARPGK